MPLQSQLDAAGRMRATRDQTDQQLRTMNLRLDELVAQAAEVSVGGGATTELGTALDDLVTQMEALRLAVADVEAVRRGPVLPPLPDLAPAAPTGPADGAPVGDAGGPRADAVTDVPVEAGNDPRPVRRARPRRRREPRTGELASHHALPGRRAHLSGDDGRPTPTMTAAAEAPTRPDAPAMGGNRLLRNNLVVAGGTAMSRLTGLIRVYAFARFVGQAAIADAYNSANGSPNAIYELLLGGVLSATLIPIFTKQAEDNDDEATSAVFTVAMIVVSAITAGRRDRRPGDLPTCSPSTSPATPTCTGPPAPRSPGSSSSRSSSTASSPWPPRCSTPTGGSSPRRGRRCCPTW